MAPDMQEVVRKLRRDLHSLRAKKGYLCAGLPHFPGLFGRDSLIVAWQMLREDPTIARSTLFRLAKLQGRRVHLRSEEEPGKILHEYYEPWQLRARLKKWRVVLWWGSPYYGSVDATPLWLIVFAAYVRATHDRRFLDTFWPNALSAFRWMAATADHNRDGFLDYVSHNPRALTHHAWKDSNEFGKLKMPLAPVEVQGYAYAAFCAFAECATVLGETAFAEEAIARASALKRSFRQAFLTNEYFAFVLDGNGVKVPWVTSNPGHLLFSGILDPADAAMVARRMFRDDLWTRYGVRTLSMRDPSFDWQSYHRGSVWPHDNWFFWKGLCTIGDAVGAARVREALLYAWTDLGGKIAELYAVDPRGHTLNLTIRTKRGVQQPGYPQAWASGALLDMITSRSI